MIDAANGQLQTKAALDHEGDARDTVIVNVSDGKDSNGETDTAIDDTVTVTITVNNVDEPADLSLAATGGVTANDNALTVGENYEGALATFSARDPEHKAGLTYDWSLGGSDASDFAISDAGVLSFAAIPTTTTPTPADR